MPKFNMNGVRGHESNLVLMDFKGKEPLDEIFQWAWDNNYHSKCTALELSVKDENKADNLRAQGNQFYKTKNYIQALKFYNLSIIAAPHPVLSNEILENSEDDSRFAFPRIDPARYGGVPIEQCSALGKGFANRSAVMFALEEYEKCIQDIDLAIESGCPEELHPKLEERKSKCSTAQAQSGTSDSWERDFATRSTSNFFERLIAKGCLFHKVPEPPVLRNPNPSIPSMSNAVKVSYWPNKGRGLVATRDVKPGEVLGVERAFAVGLSRVQLLTHCSTCTRQCFNPIPCPGCAQVVFCSKSCRTRGLSEDHWLECKILPSILVHDLDVSAESYKLLKTCNFQQMRSINKKLKNSNKPNHPERLGFDSRGKYSSSSFQSVYHLHHSLETYPFERLVPQCLAAFQLTKFLELSDRYFVDDEGKPVRVTKDDFLGTYKMLVINQLKCDENAFFSEDPEFDIFKKSFSFALSPAQSLINHSCCPVTKIVNYGRETVWFAIKPIKAGEELTVSYGGNFCSTPKNERRGDILKHLGFACQCQACEENWPTIPFLPEIRVPCNNCDKYHDSISLYCNNCMQRKRGKVGINRILEQQQNLQKFGRALDVLSQMEEKMITKQDFKRICEASEVAFKYSAMPSRVLVKFMGLLQLCGGNGCFQV